MHLCVHCQDVETTSVSTEGWIDKDDVRYTHTHTQTHTTQQKYYTAQTSETLPFVTIQVDLDGISEILSEISQMEKDKYFIISHM